MSSWRQQALIDAPKEAIWDLIADPRRYPEWAAHVVEVTGLPTSIEENAEFRQTTRMPLGEPTTTFEVDVFDELREIRMHCQTSGTYSHWVLTDAQDATFAEVEMGIEPTAMQYRLIFGILGKRYFRKLAEEAVDGLSEVVEHRPSSAEGTRQG
jgi:hypothetical protein